MVAMVSAAPRLKFDGGGHVCVSFHRRGIGFGWCIGELRPLGSQLFTFSFPRLVIHHLLIRLKYVWTFDRFTVPCVCRPWLKSLQCYCFSFQVAFFPVCSDPFQLFLHLLGSPQGHRPWPMYRGVASPRVPATHIKLQPLSIHLFSLHWTGDCFEIW